MHFIKNGYTNLNVLAADLARCMATAGYDVVGVDGTAASDINDIPTDAATELKVVMQNAAPVDPCAASQKWRMVIESTTAELRIVQATDKQIAEDGTVAKYPYIGTKSLSQNPHAFHRMSELVKDGAAKDTNESEGMIPTTDAFFSYRNQADNADPNAAPLSLMVVVSKHGLAACVWVEGQDNAGDAFSWFATQRGVDKTGNPYATGKAPLWTCYSVGGGGVGDVDAPVAATDQRISQFVVCEADVNAPTKPYAADRDTADATRLFNIQQQVSITEDEKFNLAVPRDLCTQRYFYPLEMDMIGFSSADVISQFSQANVTMYSESEQRTYKALQSNAKNNKGMRLLFLVSAKDKLIDISSLA